MKILKCEKNEMSILQVDDFLLFYYCFVSIPDLKNFFKVEEVC